MKKIILGIVLAIFFSGCSNDEDSGYNYYVKYELTMNSLHGGVTKKITYTTNEGRQRFETENVSWEGTYGPFKKGTRLVLTCVHKDQDEYSYHKTNNHAKISVCRGKEPFVIKAEDSGRHDISLVYEIDF